MIALLEAPAKDGTPHLACPALFELGCLVGNKAGIDGWVCHFFFFYFVVV